VRAKPVLIEFDRILERARKLYSEKPAPHLRRTLRQSEMDSVADAMYARMLAQDEESRSGGRRYYQNLHERILREDPEFDLRPAFPLETIPEYGLSAEQFQARQEDLRTELQTMQQALALGDWSAVKDDLDLLLYELEINLDPNSDDYRRLGMAALRAFVKALQAIDERDKGQPIATPLVPAISQGNAASGDTLSAAFEGWKRQRQRAPGTLTEYERAISLFTELHGNLPVAQIKRTHARQFREALQEVPARRSGKLLNASLPELAQWGREHPHVPKITAGTVNKQLTAVQAIANWARDNGMIPDDVQWADPFRRMRLGDEEAVRGGAPFELSDLQVIFATPIFTEGARPTGGRGDAAFWLPLLALFTGARLNELASLKASDVSHNDIIGANCIFIRAERRSGKRLKTEQSERFVPLHPQLVASGFLQLVADQQAERGATAWLFPKVAPGTTGKAAFSKWFGRYIGAHGITDGTKVFHSFRHSFIDALRLAGVPGEINIALVGHTDPSVNDKYGAKDKAIRFRHRLAEAVASVTYAGLDLSHLTRYRAVS
jgi:integrase